MSNKLKLYNVTDEYINYLMIIDKKVFSNKEEERLKGRKYLGIVLEVKEFKYFVPLSSPKDTDYIVIDDEKQIRKSIVPIMRIVSKDVLGNDELKGTLKFSNMIPIPDCALVDYDVEKEEDQDYKILITKELSFIFSKSTNILKNAQIIHNQKTKNFKIPYLESTVDFTLLEEKCKEYEINKLDKEIINKVSTQVAISDSKI